VVAVEEGLSTKALLLEDTAKCSASFLPKINYVVFPTLLPALDPSK
jgi:hypothetical protein